MTDSSNKNIQINEIESQQSTREFFNCDLFDSLPYFKDDMASMEHPVFSLTTQVDKRVLRYEHNGNSITIKPGYDGLPTIHDKDILIYAASSSPGRHEPRREHQAGRCGSRLTISLLP